MSENDELGSLAQSTRDYDLGKTRNILFIIGGLTIALNGYMFMNAENEVRQLGLAGAEYDRVLGFCRIVYGAAVLLGGVFVVSGALLKQFPVPLTILCLVLYVGATAGFAYLNPASLMSGIIFKVIIVVSLGKAVQTALAYQRDKSAGLVD